MQLKAQQWWTPARLERHGWVYYGKAPFDENLDRLYALICTCSQYEVMILDTNVFVRRFDD